MASNSKSTPIRQEVSNDPSNVTVYRWVIINGKQLLNPGTAVNQGDHPASGVWICGDPSRKDYTYIARLSSSQRDWKATFGCEYGNGGTLEAVDILGLNDCMKKEIGWKGKVEGGGSMKISPPPEAKKVPDNQIEKPGKTPESFMALDIPSPDQGGIRGDNGNRFLRLRIMPYPDGFEGTRQIPKLLWWAKKEVPGEQYTVLTDAEVLRLKSEGRISEWDLRS